VRDFEVLAEELEGKAEKRLILEKISRSKFRRGSLRTRMRWVSGFNFEVM
jgi:hypothetical protein